MSDGNREYKSDVFSMLMQDKRYALQVYNVLNHSHIEDPEPGLFYRDPEGPDYRA